MLKPLTTLLILAAALAASAQDEVYRNYIVAGLACSLLGDIALMFEGDRAFMSGLGSFLVAHLLFIVAFFWGTGLSMPPVWTLLPSAVALAFFVWLLPQTGPLFVPVMVYGTCLLVMAVLAATRAELRGEASAWIACASAFTFILSDSSLALCQFRGPYPRAQALILSTYWLAIGGLALSVM
ncbi:MAG: lysoplasmalogenase [Panacagrimonas sp.]